ncbi:hypothetical protein H9P43_001377 [Blastocladiella emersonii ATCC 22665]|nr:hypothetical protein H9P43_001377 [Blastocladiella emersonii ATCC 22665]
MDDATLASVQALCRQLYTAASPADRKRAETALARAFPSFTAADAAVAALPPTGAELAFTATTPIDGIAQTSILLEAATDPYVLTFAINHLKALVLNHFSLLALEQKIQLKTYVLNFLQTHVHAERFVTSALAQVLALMLKMAWFDADEFTDVMADLNAFIHASIPHQISGAFVLYTLVSEMNAPSSSSTRVAKHRKAVIAFRDSQLIQVFQTGVSFLQRVIGNSLSFSSDAERTTYVSSAVTLLRACLSFDFIGTSPDESSDDVGSLQVPSSWRSILDENFVNLLFRCYIDAAAKATDAANAMTDGSSAMSMGMSPPSSASATVATASAIMECISFVVSVRRSLYNDKERLVWAGAIMHNLVAVMSQNIGLDQAENYHEVCKTLARFKTTYHHTELSSRDEFPAWLEAVTQFSTQGLVSWNWSPNSDHYLLTFWAKSATAAIPNNEKLDQYSLHVAQNYIASRVDAFEAIIAKDLENFFDEEEPMIVNIETLATFARRVYDDLAKFVLSTLNTVLMSYQSTYSPLAERQLTYLIYVAGALVGSRIPYQSPDVHDQLDGELACLIFKALELQQSAPSKPVYTEHAFLYFYSQFRKSYIGESAQRASKVYDPLSSALGIAEQEHAMEVFTRQIVRVLRTHPSERTLIDKTLRLLHDLSLGYVSVKLMAKLDATKALLQDHAFAFLDACPSTRTGYYTTLSRILFCEDVSDDQFAAFVRPLDDRFAALARIHASGDAHALKTPLAQRTLIGLFRDLRGCLTSVTNKSNFSLFWDWLYPGKIELVVAAMDALAGTPEVAVALLKFFSELVLNRSNRLVFDLNSVNGILLFRETSRLLRVYATHVLAAPAPTSDHDAYRTMYKGIAVTMRILKASLSGGYANFGVFGLYRDDAFEGALASVSALCLRIPTPHLMSYPKLAQAFFELCETLTQAQHLALVTNLDANFFAYMGQAIAEALKQPAVAVPANVVDNVATFLYSEQMRAVKQQQQQGGPGSPMQARSPALHCVIVAFSQFPDLLTYWMTLILNALLFEDTQIQWSLSRPLLPLILLNQDFFDSYCASLVRSQLPARQPLVAELVADLLKDVDFALTSKSRDRLTNNIGAFRRETSAQNITLLSPS